jgi:phytoene dehydrogenase-like protein
LIQELQHKDSVMKDKVGNDSVLTLFLGTNIDPVVLSSKISGHFFYTPSRKGQSLAGKIPVGKDKKTILSWLEEFLALTTYEISIPVLRDPSLAPPGKSGFVISVLFDYSLTKHIDDMGWYQDFKSKSESIIIRTLQNSIFPEIKGAIIHQFLSTPMTMERLSGNFMGAITGWSFTNHPLPAESRLPKIMSSTRTQIPNVFQAGQWTYSPSGLPISILTGKLAADGVQKELKRKQ